MSKSGNLVRATVIGPWAVCGVDPGGEVEIDPGVYHVPALIEGGHIKLITTTPAAKAASKPAEPGPDPKPAPGK